MLSVLNLSVPTTPTTLPKHTDLKQRKNKNVMKSNKKKNNSHGRKEHANSFEDSDSVGNEDDSSTTQIMGGSTLEGGHRTDRPLVPSLSPPWVILNAATLRHPSVSAILLLLLLPTTL